MNLLRLAPVVVAALVLGAHFYRASIDAGVALSIALLGLVLVRKPWAARVVQAGLVLGALEWLRTLAAFAGVRLATGQPYMRMVLILGAVALLTALAALVFESRALRVRYGLSGAA